jgi:hypothetical protein
MSDIVVFPEQFSFDVRVQRNNPRRRLTIKNLGIMAAKLTITLPETDAFFVTDSKGRTLTSSAMVTMNPDTSHFLFVQKRPTVGIAPEAEIVISGGTKTYHVALKPAVSLVSLEELEAVADKRETDDSAVPSFSASDVEEPHQDRRSRIPTAEPAKRVSRAASEPARVDVEPEPARKPSGIPIGRTRRRQELGPGADVLEQSMHVRFSFREVGARPRSIGWYEPDAFANLQEPEFTFELMVTGDNEEPVFCIDGDYYDASGRLLSVQQGKGKVIYVTENGYDPMEDFEC